MGTKTRLRRRRALIALLVVIGLWLVALPFRSTAWGGWLLAFAEAGIIGGLADWFAVTALFRRPLGLPIPHTALIPSNWKLLAKRVGTMVGDRVLTRAFLMQDLERLDVSTLIARAAGRVRREDLESATRAALEWGAAEVSPASLRDLLMRVRRFLLDKPAAPTLAGLLLAACEHGWDRRAADLIVETLVDLVESPGFHQAVRGIVDDFIARYAEQVGAGRRVAIALAELFGLIDRSRIVDALRDGLREVAADPAHPLRERVAGLVHDLAHRLEHDANLGRRVEAFKADLLTSPVLARLAERLASALGDTLRSDLARPRPDLVTWLVDHLERLRERLVSDAGVREDIAGWIRGLLVAAVDSHHGKIATYVEEGVRTLGPEGAVRLVEEYAGDDLQYIRINGTVVGGIAGAALHGLRLLLGLS